MRDEKPNPSRKLKERNKRQKAVAFAEMINIELQIWVRRRGLKMEIKEEKECGEVGLY